MDGDLVRDKSLSSNEGSGGTAPAPLKSYHEKFEELFPFYLSLGMTVEQYWEGDSQLTVYFRKAHDLKRDRMNQEAWLQGAYFYEALSRISPILHAFAKKGTKPQPYLDQPLSLTEAQEKAKQLQRDKATYDKGLAKMQGYMAAVNKKFDKERK